MDKRLAQNLKLNGKNQIVDSGGNVLSILQQPPVRKKRIMALPVVEEQRLDMTVNHAELNHVINELNERLVICNRRYAELLTVLENAGVVKKHVADSE